MTYRSNDPDPALRNRRGYRDRSSYTGWIIGGAVAFAVILGVLFMGGRHDASNTAANNSRPHSMTVPVPAPVTTPSTTGSSPAR